MRYTNNVTFFLLGNKYDGDRRHGVDDEMSDAFAIHKNIKVHFKISTQESDDATFSDMLQRMAEYMYKKRELNFTSTASNGHCASTSRDNVTLLTGGDTPPDEKSGCCSRS